MRESNEKEIILLNLVLLVLALVCLFAAGWAAIGDTFKAGVDDLFLLLVALLLALLFIISPVMWVYQKGWLRNPFKKSDKATEEPANKDTKVPAR